jgi:hypothetical protein
MLPLGATVMPLEWLVSVGKERISLPVSQSSSMAIRGWSFWSMTQTPSSVACMPLGWGQGVYQRSWAVTFWTLGAVAVTGGAPSLSMVARGSDRAVRGRVAPASCAVRLPPGLKNDRRNRVQRYALGQAVEGAGGREAGESRSASRRAQIAKLVPHEEWVLAGGVRERAVLLDAAGRVVARKEGDRGGVDWTAAALVRLVGRVDLVTHNHAGGKSVGEDDAGVAVGLDAREVNAVTPAMRYRLYRSGAIWPDARLLASVIDEEKAQLAGEMITAREDGRIDDTMIERMFHHVLWGRVARRFRNRIHYEVERRG